MTNAKDMSDKVKKPKQSTSDVLAPEEVEADPPADPEADEPARSRGRGYINAHGVFTPEELVRNFYSKVGLDERARAEAVHSDLRHIVLGMDHQKVIILTNREAVRLRSGVTKYLCCQSNHRVNERLSTARIRHEQDITDVLQKHPNVVGIVIDFEPHFTFSQVFLANALFELCPLLEHLEWATEEPKTEFLNALNNVDIRFLTCWKVFIAQQDVELAVNVLSRRADNQLRSLSVGRHLATFLAGLNTEPLEWLEVKTQEELVPMNIEQCHRLKALFLVNDGQQYLGEPTIFEILQNNPLLETLHIPLVYDVQATTVPFMAQHCRNLSNLKIITEPDYYTPEDWTALSTLRKLRSLSLTGIAEGGQFFDGICLILLKCKGLQELGLEHLQDVLLDPMEIRRIQDNLSLVVEYAPLDPSTDRFDTDRTNPRSACRMRFTRRWPRPLPPRPRKKVTSTPPTLGSQPLIS